MTGQNQKLSSNHAADADTSAERIYAHALTAKGLDPDIAAEVARRTRRSCHVTGDAVAREPSVVRPPRHKRRADAALLESAAEIGSTTPGACDIAYQHTIMCQIGLPRSKAAVDGLTVFERRCGDAVLRVTAGALFDGERLVQQPIPYGAYPRLILAWLNTRAVITRSPVIEVGDSAAAFLRVLGKSCTGGANGSLTHFRRHMQALAACHLTLGLNAAGRAYTYTGQPVQQFLAWVASKTEHQRSLWPGVVTFGGDYYRSLIEHAVPQDVRAMYALKGSALAMDVYGMLAERLHRVTGRPVTLTWAMLRGQFGQEYRGRHPDKDFRAAFLAALKSVLAVYPTAKVEQVRGGLRLHASPPPIAYR